MCRTMTSHLDILTSVGNGPARRRLFGPVDREALWAEYQTALRKDLEEASRRWGFDFLSDQPLQGDHFQWEGVSGTKVPLLYRSCMSGPGQTRGRRSSNKERVAATGGRKAGLQRDKENIPHTPERRSFSPENLEKTPERGNARAKRKQTNITDFYQAKRRVVGMPRKSGQ